MDVSLKSSNLVAAPRRARGWWPRANFHGYATLAAARVASARCVATIFIASGIPRPAHLPTTTVSTDNAAYRSTCATSPTGGIASRRHVRDTGALDAAARQFTDPLAAGSALRHREADREADREASLLVVPTSVATCSALCVRANVSQSKAGASSSPRARRPSPSTWPVPAPTVSADDAPKKAASCPGHDAPLAVARHHSCQPTHFSDSLISSREFPFRARW